MKLALLALAFASLFVLRAGPALCTDYWCPSYPCWNGAECGRCVREYVLVERAGEPADPGRGPR